MKTVNGILAGMATAALLAAPGGTMAGEATVAENDGEPRDSKPIESMVVTGQVSRFGATKSDTPIVETARSVSVEPFDYYIEKGALELDDVLGYTAGVLGDSFGFSLRGDFPYVRGLDVPEYRDGLQTLFGFYNNTRPHIYALEQVEVLKGPASVLFGQGAPGGVVNVVSKRPLDTFEGNAFVSAGTFDRFEGGLDFTGPLNESGTILGRIVAVVRDSGTQIREINDDTLTVAPSLTFKPTEDTNITILGEYVKTDSDTAHQFTPIIGTLYPHPSGMEIDPNFYAGEPGWNRYDTESKAVTLIADHRFADWIAVEMTSRYRESTSKYNQSWILFQGAGVPRTDINGDGPRTWYVSNAFSEAFAIDARVRLNFATGALEHEVLAGVNYQDVKYGADNSYITAFSTLNVFDPVYGIMPTQADFDAAAYSQSNRADMLGFYISDQIEWNNWVLTAGIRIDDTRTDGQNDSAESLSVGLLYKFDFGLSPYVSYAESFQPVVGTDQLTGDPLKPQQGRQYEVGIKYQVSPRIFLTAAWFDIHQTNLPNPGGLIGQVPSQQEGVAKIQGFEFEGYAASGPFSLEVNFSTLSTRNPDGFRLSSIPKTLASVWAAYRPQDGALAGFRAGFGVRYASKNVSETAAIRVETPGYTVFDAMIGYAFEDWLVSLNVRNLADKKYFATCLSRGDCFPGERRTVVGRVSRSF